MSNPTSKCPPLPVLRKVWADYTEGCVTVAELAARYQTSPRTVRNWWIRYGLATDAEAETPPYMQAVQRRRDTVRYLVQTYPWLGDSTVAALLSVAASAPVPAHMARADRTYLGIPNSHDRIAAEVAVYVRDWPDLSPETIRDCMRADGWPVSLRAVVAGVEAARERMRGAA